jgi:hypothetical protein
MNPLITTIIIFFLLIVVLAVIIRFVKKMVRIVIIIAIIVLVVGASIYILRDANSLRENFLPGEKLVILELDNKIVSAIISKDVSVPTPVTTIGNLDDLYAIKDLDKMLNDKYKLVIFKWKAFEKIDFVGDGDYEFSMDEIKSIMESNNAKQFIIDKMVKEQGAEFESIIQTKVDEMFTTDDHLKSILFGFMIAKFVEKNSVFEEYIDENVFIYPETITLKLIKILPISWMKGFLPEKTF